MVKPLSKCIKEIDAPAGKKRLADHLHSLPFPHFEAVVGRRGLLTRIEADGTRTVGRFVNRKFQAVKTAKK